MRKSRASLLLVASSRVPQLEQDAAALHYDNPEVLLIQRVELGNGGNPLSAKQTIRMANGQELRISCERHPDPHVEAIRWHRSDAEVIQALHRARIYDRTSKNPVEIHLFGQTDTGLPVHEVRRWIDAARTPMALMVAGGAVFKSSRYAEIAYPHIFSARSARTIRRFIEGEVSAIDLNNIYALGVWPELWRTQQLSDCETEWREVYFSPVEGRKGGKIPSVWIDFARYPDPKMAIQDALGCQIEIIRADDSNDK